VKAVKHQPGDLGYWLSEDYPPLACMLLWGGRKVLLRLKRRTAKRAKRVFRDSIPFGSSILFFLPERRLPSKQILSLYRRCKYAFIVWQRLALEAEWLHSNVKPLRVKQRYVKIRGLSYTQIAADIGIAKRTVERAMEALKRFELISVRPRIRRTSLLALKWRRMPRKTRRVLLNEIWPKLAIQPYRAGAKLGGAERAKLGGACRKISVRHEGKGAKLGGAVQVRGTFPIQVQEKSTIIDAAKGGALRAPVSLRSTFQKPAVPSSGLEKDEKESPVKETSPALPSRLPSAIELFASLRLPDEPKGWRFALSERSPIHRILNDEDYIRTHRKDYWDKRTGISDPSPADDQKVLRILPGGKSSHSDVGVTARHEQVARMVWTVYEMIFAGRTQLNYRRQGEQGFKRQATHLIRCADLLMQQDLVPHMRQCLTALFDDHANWRNRPVRARYPMVTSLYSGHALDVYLRVAAKHSDVVDRCSPIETTAEFLEYFFLQQREKPITPRQWIEENPDEDATPFLRQFFFPEGGP
jgi:hypothetical protein